MSTQKIIIDSEESAFEYLDKALKGAYDNKNIEFNFESWPLLNINVKGDRYQSTLTAALMRSLIDLQVHLNWVYGQIIYGRDGRSLTDEERASIELVYKIEDGSSNVVADLSGFFTELGKGAVEKLTGKQIVTLVVGVATLWFLSSSYDNFIDSQQEALKEKNRHDLTMALIAKEPKMAQIQSEHIEKLVGIVKSVPDADQVLIGDTTLNKMDISEINKVDRKSTKIERVDGEYKITGLKNREASFGVEITRVSDGYVFSTTLEKGYLSIDEMSEITKAFSIQSKIKLNIVARVRGDSIYSAKIIGVNYKANGIVVKKEND